MKKWLPLLAAAIGGLGPQKPIQMSCNVVVVG